MNRKTQRNRISLRQNMRPVPFQGDVLRGLVHKAFRFLGLTGADIRILVVGDEEMARWNREFRGREGTTNVLSFPEVENGKERPSRLAGDILISASACLSQTKDWPCSKEERVFFFVVHGMVHLLGYDHEKGRAEAARMRRKEVRVYRSCLKEGRSPI